MLSLASLRAHWRIQAAGFAFGAFVSLVSFACAEDEPATEINPLAGGGSPAASATNSAEVRQTATAPATTAPTTAAGLQLTVSSPVARGRDATAAVSGAAAGSNCTIAYRTPAGTDSTAQGLAAKAAGADGKASWTWAISANTNPGTGRVTVQCGAASTNAAITIQ